jgi:hypothetical protein
MSKEIEISKIIIKIGKKEIKLSPKEAKQLQTALNDTLGANTRTWISTPWTIYYGTVPASSDVFIGDDLGTITYALSDGVNSNVVG